MGRRTMDVCIQIAEELGIAHIGLEYRLGDGSTIEVTDPGADGGRGATRTIDSSSIREELTRIAAEYAETSS